MAKAQEASVQYDASASQNIPLVLNGRGKDFTVRHILDPLSDDRYFLFQEELERTVGRIRKTEKLTTAMHQPKDNLWDDLATGVEGYKERDDWKAGVHQTHKTAVISALCDVQLLDEEAEEEITAWDIDAPITVPFRAMYSGTLLLDLKLIFRPETAAEMDEFLSLETRQPNPQELASAQKTSQAARLARLGRKLLTDQHGYKDGSTVPAWHLAPATEAFFLRQIAQTGKSSA